MVDGLVVSCLRWIEGRPLGEAVAPLENSAVLARAGDFGALIADLHNATDAGACPEAFPRAGWAAEALLGETPRLGRFWEAPTLSAEESAILRAARDKALALLPRATDFGPIHADTLRSNVMMTRDGLRLIDFDDCGPGWRLYDLASALVQSWGDPLLTEHARRLVAGYRRRRDLPADQLALLPLFLAVRAFVSAGWVVTRAPEDSRRQRAYAYRAVALARMLLAGDSPWGEIG
jgi:Ser/Thr protein kinase RdoA (MazF antagonist)